MNEIYWIRHASTAGNRSRRYVGRTDEPALEEALRVFRNIYPDVTELDFEGIAHGDGVVDADGNPVSEGTAGINWSVYWDNDVSHISSESSNQYRNRLVTVGGGNEAMVGSKRLTIKADSINGHLSSMIADDYVATLKLMLDSV